MLAPEGYFLANKYGPIFITQYTVLVYQDRLIFVRTGSQFSDYRKATLNGLSEMMQDELLAANKANFILNTDEISSISLKKDSYNWWFSQDRIGTFIILLKNKKRIRLDLSLHIKYDDISALLQRVIPEKLQTSK